MVNGCQLDLEWGSVHTFQAGRGAASLPAVERGDQRRQAGVQRDRPPLEVDQGRGPRPACDVAEVRPVALGPVGELFLSQPEYLPPRLHGEPEPLAPVGLPPPPSAPSIRAEAVKKFARLAVAHADKLDRLDEWTEESSGTKGGAPGTAGADSTSLVVTARMSDIELSKSRTNRVWRLGDGPGRTVTTALRTDGLVPEWSTAPQKSRDPARADSLRLTPTPTRRTAEFPDEEALARTELGTLRNEFLGDGDKAQKVRAGPFADAQDWAVARSRERKPAEADELAAASQAEVPAARPANPARVTWAGSGRVVEIERFFTAAPDPPPVGEVGLPPSVPRGLAASALALVVLAVLTFSVFRRRSSP